MGRESSGLAHAKKKGQVNARGEHWEIVCLDERSTLTAQVAGESSRPYLQVMKKKGYWALFLKTMHGTEHAAAV